MLTCITQRLRPTKISTHRVISLSTKAISWSYIPLDTQKYVLILFKSQVLISVEKIVKC